MNVVASELLARITLLHGGISKTPTVRQSECVVFQSGKAYTFSGDVFAVTDLDLGFNGAIKYSLLVDILQRAGENTVEITPLDSKGGIQISCGRSRSTVPTERPLIQSLSSVAEPPTSWLPLNKEYRKAILSCESVIVRSDLDEVLSSIHFDLDKIEAGSTSQLIRIHLPSPFPKRFLVRGGILKKLFICGVTEMQLNDKWLFFKNDSTVYGTPIYDDAFLALDSYFQPASEIIVFPREELLKELQLCGVFERGCVLKVELDSQASVCRLSSNTSKGKFDCEMPMNTPISIKFKISPDLFMRVLSDFEECTIGSNGIHINTPFLSYAASIE